MYKIVILFFASFILNNTQAQITEQQFIDSNAEFATYQMKLMLASADKSKTAMPHSITKDGKLQSSSIYGWTSGFFPGTLWYLTEFNKDKSLQDSALIWTNKLKPVSTFTDNHDIGFMMYCSYGNAYRITKNEEYKDILLQSAKSLMTRYNPHLGVIKSWNSWRTWDGDQKFNFPVIIDNMMNLELLVFASKVSGDKTFEQAAISHATKTMKYQVRKDGSCFHIMTYDTGTGKPLQGVTSQGYSNNSAWSRGQGWGIYGFTLMYRETKVKSFLKTAERLANFYINHPNLPADKIAYWDFNANQPGYNPGIRSYANKMTERYRDASAAAVTASALLELSTFVKGKKATLYFETAKQILKSLGGTAYRAKAGANANFILMHSVGSIPHNSEIDVPLVYADYYFVEGLMRYNAIVNNKPLPIY